MPDNGTSPFATFLIIGPTCFFLGILFAYFPYDYNVLWTIPPPLPDDPTADPRTPYFALLENHLKFLHASPPLISRILHIVIGVGLFGLLIKLYKPTQANLLFDGASLVMYMCGVTVYIANIVRGLRTVTNGAYGTAGSAAGAASDVLSSDEAAQDAIAKGAMAGVEQEFIGREDSLRVLAASNTILALVLIGVLVLQAGQWYAQRAEAKELEQMDKARDEKRLQKAKEAAAAAGGAGGTKKRQ